MTALEPWTPTQDDLETTDEFYQAILSPLQSDRGVHAETAVAAAARMAGTFLFQSFNLPMTGITPGSAVLSDVANEQGPELIGALFGVLGALKVPLDPSKVTYDTPEENRPQWSVLETQSRLGATFRAAAARHGLADRRAAFASVMAAAWLIRDTASVLDPHIAAGIALYGFVEGAKTAPATSE